jgi:hypothetical protein
MDRRVRKISTNCKERDKHMSKDTNPVLMSKRYQSRVKKRRIGRYKLGSRKKGSGVIYILFLLLMEEW